MSWNNRVVGAKGSFCCRRCFSSRNAIWTRHSLPQPAAVALFLGVQQIEIDSEALNIGKLVLTEAAGVLPTVRCLLRRATHRCRRR